MGSQAISLHHRRARHDRRHDDADRQVDTSPACTPCEEFDPDPYMDALNKWGLPWQIDDDPVLVD